MERPIVNTRQRILEILLRQEATAKDLALSLGLAPMTVRHHLNLLQRDELVTFQERRRGPGRPRHSFLLTKQGREEVPKDYQALAARILHELALLSPMELSGLSGEGVKALLFSRAAERLARHYSPRMEGKALAERLDEAVQILRAEHFPCESDGELRIRCFACPYHQLAMRDKKVCSFDLHFLASLLQAEVRLEEHIASGDDNCVFVISESLAQNGGKDDNLNY